MDYIKEKYNTNLELVREYIEENRIKEAFDVFKIIEKESKDNYLRKRLKKERKLVKRRYNQYLDETRIGLLDEQGRIELNRIAVSMYELTELIEERLNPVENEDRENGDYKITVEINLNIPLNKLNKVAEILNTLLPDLSINMENHQIDKLEKGSSIIFMNTNLESTERLIQIRKSNLIPELVDIIFPKNDEWLEYLNNTVEPIYLNSLLKTKWWSESSISNPAWGINSDELEM